jgi:hypothetical protein
MGPTLPCSQINHTPLTVSDYKPISLLNTSIKLVTKILANRLQKFIVNLIHKNYMGSSECAPFRTVWLGPLNIFICANNLKGKWLF